MVKYYVKNSRTILLGPFNTPAEAREAIPLNLELEIIKVKEEKPKVETYQVLKKKVK